jgi:hypothetical protein
MFVAISPARGKNFVHRAKYWIVLGNSIRARFAFFRIFNLDKIGVHRCNGIGLDLAGMR